MIPNWEERLGHSVSNFHLFTWQFPSHERIFNFSLSAELLSWRTRPSVRPLTQLSQKPLHGSWPNYVESYFSAISSDLFVFSNFFIFKFLRNFNMGVNGKTLRYGISWKRADLRAKRAEIWDSDPKVYICRILFMPDCLSLVWGHSVHFAKFPIPRFSKRYSNHFHQFQLNFTRSIIIRG